MTDQLVRGIELAKEAVGAESARIEIYKELGDSPVTIGEDLGGVPVDRVAPVTRRQLADPEAPEEKASVFGACALIHLARAVDEKIGPDHCVCDSGWRRQ